jgi:hypothetical protein
MWYLLKRLFGMKSKERPMEVETLRLENGDVLVVRCDQKLSVTQYEMVRKKFEKAFTGPNIPIVILDGGLKLSVLNTGEEVHSNECDTKDIPSKGTTPHET